MCLRLHDGQKIAFPLAQLAVVIADENQQVFVRIEGYLAQVRRRRFAAAMNTAERIGRRHRLRHFHLERFFGRGFLDRKIAPALQRERMRGVEHRLDFFQADARVLDVVAHAVGVALERLNGVLGAGRAKGEIVLEKIVVAVDVGDGQHLQRQAVVAHQVGDRRVGVDHHFVRQTAHAVFVESL